MTTNIKHAEASLWCLQNPFETLHCLEEPLMCEIKTPHNLVDGPRSPLLFIHGAEYHSNGEILSDLVLPMLTTMNVPRENFSPCYFIAWNSTLIPCERRALVQSMPPLRRSMNYAIELGRWPQYLTDLERRADDTASFLAPFIVEWASQRRSGPTVISHSMGGYVWAQTLQEIYESSTMLARPGIWWNLQPALVRNAFTDRGAYSLVARSYNNSSSRNAVTWYSRLDFVLSSLYLLSKGELALGQWGCPEQTLPQRDVTVWAREAHGMNHIQSAAGNFFRRVSHLIPYEARRLGII